MEKELETPPGRCSSRPSIEIHIEELVLQGFSPGDRYGIGEAVQRELARLFAERPEALPAQSREVERIDAGLFPLDSPGRTDSIGAAIAGALYEAIAGGSAKADPNQK